MNVISGDIFVIIRVRALNEQSPDKVGFRTTCHK
jgi:hypothetical protein